MSTKKAEWRIVNGEFDEEYVQRLKNGRWTHKKTSMVRNGSGSWDTEVTYIDEDEAARLIMEAGFDLEGTQLDEYVVDTID